MSALSSSQAEHFDRTTDDEREVVRDSPSFRSNLTRVLREICGALCLMAFSLLVSVVLGKMVDTSWYATVPFVATLAALSVLAFHGRAVCSAAFGFLADRVLLWRAIQVVSFGLLLWVAFTSRVTLGWDWSELITAASEYVLDGAVQDRAYFARYPNNAVWLSCLVLLFKLCHLIVPSSDITLFTNVSMVVNCLIILLSMGVIKRVAEKLWGPSWGLLVGVCASLYAPFYCYSSFAYSDSIGILCASLVLLIYVTLIGECPRGISRMVLLVLLGCILAFLWKVKIMLFIVAIAMLVDCLVCNRIGLALIRSVLVVLLAFVVARMGFTSLGDTYLHITDDEYEQYEYPVVHWLMMSANPECDGGYNIPDDAFTRSFATYQQRKDAARYEFVSRVKTLGVFGFARHCLVDKTKRMWGDSTLFGANYLSREPLYPSNLSSRLLSEEGDLNKWLLLVSWPGHLLLLLGLTLSALGMLSGRDERTTYCFLIALFGAFLFFLVWESNARYLYAFSPLLLLGGFDGLRLAWRSLGLHGHVADAAAPSGDVW